MSVLKHTMLCLDYGAKQGYDKEVLFAICLHDTGKEFCHRIYGNLHNHEVEGLPFVNDFCDRFKVPNNYRELALLVCEHHQRIHNAFGRNSNKGLRPKSIMKLFEVTSALTKPKRFYKILQACVADARGRGGDFSNRDYPQSLYLWECLNAAKRVDTSSISGKMLSEGKEGTQIGEAIRVARIQSIRGVSNRWENK